MASRDPRYFTSRRFKYVHLYVKVKFAGDGKLDDPMLGNYVDLVRSGDWLEKVVFGF